MIYTKKQAADIFCPSRGAGCLADICAAWRWANWQVLEPAKSGNLAKFINPKAALKAEMATMVSCVPEATPPGCTGEFYGFCGLAGKPKYEWGTEG